jgi:hypothetical protein
MQGQSVWLAMLAEVTQGNPAISTLTYLRTTCHQQSTCTAQSISSPQQILPIYMPATCLSRCLRASQTVLTFCKNGLLPPPAQVHRSSSSLDEGKAFPVVQMRGNNPDRLQQSLPLSKLIKLGEWAAPIKTIKLPWPAVQCAIQQ